MLQQTQVKTVIPYFNNFVKKVPNLKALSSCNEKKILKLWEGLGYYKRAINLHKTAKILMKNYKERLEYELGVIIKMGFPGYFLIVWDFINYAKEQNIPVGPGRGSGAGSLVAWSLRITDLDPIPYDLIFERFLNPERVSPPDVDIDFCQIRRPEVIDYVRQKYGERCVSHIITYGSMGAKSVIRDVARVMGVSYGEADRIAKMIEARPGVKLKEEFEDLYRLHTSDDNDDKQEVEDRVAFINKHKIPREDVRVWTANVQATTYSKELVVSEKQSLRKAAKILPYPEDTEPGRLKHIRHQLELLYQDHPDNEEIATLYLYDLWTQMGEGNKDYAQASEVLPSR